ncbi:hypothetical protein E5A73_04795 [Sphingomonas gei]|uniref:Helix-turn-helix domain-containing protein n=1 Tax=Sphingomonas gei TaxID=1395960 RepID=A0A4S1XI78_9SPHN|nr:hypothetical protein [Sphingomonas gei]TGX54776.1 hypothetical protein E5A73_04795 [Sphingomonas gei]
MKVNASEQDIFRATTGLAIHASLARTLAYCLYWCQHATHWDGDAPAIWKTGPELRAEQRIAARTANRHFKELAALGYWTISYRPRPGTIGKVTWLTMTTRGLDLVALARQQAVLRSAKKSKKGTPDGTSESQPDAAVPVDPSSYDVTSKQVHHSAKTTKNGKGFILPSEAGKKGMNEAYPSGYSGKDGKKVPKAPGYVKACPADYAFAAIVREVWTSATLQEWDWSSKFTWENIAEIRSKAGTIGVPESDMADFVHALVQNWSWLRWCMAQRFVDHPSNLHAPSPMALAHEFDVLGKKMLDRIAEMKNPPKKSNLNDDW